MAKFEYQFLADDDGALNQQEFETLFNDLGADGWEYLGVIDHAVGDQIQSRHLFKRSTG
jgi:hypothetical protein